MGVGVEGRLGRSCPGILRNKDHLLLSVLDQKDEKKRGMRKEPLGFAIPSQAEWLNRAGSDTSWAAPTALP